MKLELSFLASAGVITFVVAPISSKSLAVTSSTSTFVRETGPTMEYRGFGFNTGDGRVPTFHCSLGQVLEVAAVSTLFASTSTCSWGSIEDGVDVLYLMLGLSQLLLPMFPVWKSPSSWGPEALVLGQGPFEHLLSAARGCNQPSSTQSWHKSSRHPSYPHQWSQLNDSSGLKVILPNLHQ